MKIQALGGLAAVGLFALGLGVAGVQGALTGIVASVGVFSGLAIALAGKGTGVATSDPPRGAQRIGGAVAAIATGTGAVYGGWAAGWLYGLFGYAVGIGAGLVIFARQKKPPA